MREDIIARMKLAKDNLTRLQMLKDFRKELSFAQFRSIIQECFSANIDDLYEAIIEFKNELERHDITALINNIENDSEQSKLIIKCDSQSILEPDQELGLIEDLNEDDKTSTIINCSNFKGYVLACSIKRLIQDSNKILCLRERRNDIKAEDFADIVIEYTHSPIIVIDELQKYIPEDELINLMSPIIKNPKDRNNNSFGIKNNLLPPPEYTDYTKYFIEELAFNCEYYNLRDSLLVMKDRELLETIKIINKKYQKMFWIMALDNEFVLIKQIYMLLDENNEMELLNHFSAVIMRKFGIALETIDMLSLEAKRSICTNCFKCCSFETFKDTYMMEKYFRLVLSQLHNTNNIDFKKIEEIIYRIETSNSIEIRRMKEQIYNMLFKKKSLKEIEKTLDSIEHIFLKNNIPLCGKMFACFQILYPDFKGVKGDRNEAFDFDNKSRVAPQLKNNSLPNLPTVGVELSNNDKRYQIIFNDLLRIAYRTSGKEFIDYLNNIELGNDIYEKISKNNFDISNLTKKEKRILGIFINHLEALYENATRGKQNSIDEETLATMSLSDKTKLFGELFRPRSELKDTIVVAFGFLSGIRTFNQLKELTLNSRKEAHKRNVERANKMLANKERFQFEEGDFVRGIGYYQVLSSSIGTGNYCKEHLICFDKGSNTDTTGLDVDLTYVTRTKDIYHAIANTATGFGFGNIYVIFKKDNPNLNITRDSAGNLTNAKYNPRKIETFGTNFEGTNKALEHWGMRTGFAFTDIDYILYKRNSTIDECNPYNPNGTVNYVNKQSNEDDLYAIKFEIVRNGYYIPVIDFSGKLIFTPKEYDTLREKMKGLSYYDYQYDDPKENEYEFSDKIRPQPEETERLSKILEDSKKEVEEKRYKIIDKIFAPVLEEFKLRLKTEMDGDLTPGSIELIDTGSTGRGTNIPGDGDFDFMLRADRNIILGDSNFKNKLASMIERFPYEEKSITDQGDFRYKKVKLDEKTTVDIDISFDVKTNKIEYSSDECLKDRLETIKSQDRDKYNYVVANIIEAKQFLKQCGAYKPRRKDKKQGGLGGVGIENWILQNGGSFYEAAKSFVASAEGKTFNEFCKEYQIWDFGQNHFAARDNDYLYNNFVMDNMNPKGYETMFNALKKYIDEYGSSKNNNSILENNNKKKGNIEFYTLTIINVLLSLITIIFILLNKK